MSHSGFDQVVVVDWSASTSPSPRKPSPDAIWIGVSSAAGSATTYHRTRLDAGHRVRDLIRQATEAGQRLLIGFDFPFGYPEGFAQRLTGAGGAAAVWDWLARHVIDDASNANNRFALANGINATLGGRGPFWGRPRSLPLPHLPERKLVDYPALNLAERRRVEQAVPRAQPVWKMYTTGSVGSQAMMGLPLIHDLSSAPGVAVWPFADTSNASVVLAEVYPSLIDAALKQAHDPVKDQAQVRLLATALWRLGQGGQLGALMQDIPDWPGRADEGWILGAGHSATLLAALA